MRKRKCVERKIKSFLKGVHSVHFFIFILKSII
nr:MAG TPA: hypothetical protein [Caudoviricetes sp.]DAO73926.1 MAG TPA: hypothetical protein [Caudoviricetes sp.]DAS04445.1 MAG TPA: hypothetical protein [Caudoviricetes sp.]